MRPVDPLHPRPSARTAGGHGCDRLTPDLVEVNRLNAGYFHALDGLLGGESASRWAACFTADGSFALLDAGGAVLSGATGAAGLVELHASFPSMLTTRHWCHNHLVEPDGEGMTGLCYVAAVNVAAEPPTIERTGVYRDRLVREGGRWRYRRRTLTLDPQRPAFRKMPLRAGIDVKEHW